VTKTFRRRNDLKLRRPKVLMIPFILKVLQPADGWEDSFQIWRRVLALLLAQSQLKKNEKVNRQIKSISTLKYVFWPPGRYAEVLLHKNNVSINIGNLDFWVTTILEQSILPNFLNGRVGAVE